VKVVVLGARGFVGSAFVRLFDALGVDCTAVDRAGYDQAVRQPCDVLIHAAGNSAKYIADRDPLADFQQSVTLAMRALSDFKPDLYVLVSSVDVYPELSSPGSTNETTPIDPVASSAYGFHKRLAELCVQRHARRWLIPRLAGMVGPGLRKNPIYDVLHGLPLRIHPDSKYQFMRTDDVASAVWELVTAGVHGEIFNIAGRGLISPREIAALAQRPLQVHPDAQDDAPRIVDVSIDKMSARRSIPATRDTVAAFVQSEQAAAR
jgi:nucleoside-diphosphate-sugar epimerase